MWHTHNCTHSDLSRSPSRMSCMTRAGRTPHHHVRPRRQRPHLDAPCLACKCPTWHPHPLPLSVSPDARIETADSTIYTTTTAPPIPPVMAPSTRARGGSTTSSTRLSSCRTTHPDPGGKADSPGVMYRWWPSYPMPQQPTPGGYPWRRVQSVSLQLMWAREAISRHAH